VTTNENGSGAGTANPQSWGLAGVIFVIGAICVFTFMPSSEERIKEAREKAARYDEYGAAEKKLAESKLAGSTALEDADNAIRAEAADRRTRLEKTSVRTTMSNKNGVRIDRYFFESGKVITCTTTISGNSPAMFDCDGNL
jgi:hypothetical protein